MTAPVYVCPRIQPSQLFGQTFDDERQMRLLAYAAAPAVPLQLERRSERFALPWPQRNAGVLCIGEAVRPLLMSVRGRGANAVGQAAFGQAPDWPQWGTLVLLAPDLGADFFATGGDTLGEAAFALRCFRRIVVLHCPADIAIEGELGRYGPTTGADPRVSAVDISSYIEYRDDSAYGALCSCETLSLMLRLLQGLALPASLPPRPRVPTA